MNATRDERLHWAHPLSILMTCPVDTCDGQIRLRSVGGHRPRGVGWCPVCGVPVVLRAGVLEAADDQRPRSLHPEVER
ncbi:MAG TPA: hypothetical protein VNS19_10795 [Acidimicrobiales bacterium]|nr:hypothetical protein [Acidimicrobiales bacterium]